jgi:hypothetical protein
LNGFWLVTRVQTLVNDMLTIDGIVREEFAKDEPFIGPVSEQPRPLFRVAQDVYEGYVLLVPGDDDIHVKLVWVALALSNHVLSTISKHSANQGSVFYAYIKDESCVVQINAGWNTKRTMKWKATSIEPPSWIHTSCILTAWKKRSNVGSICIPAVQFEIANDSLARCEEVDLVRSDYCSDWLPCVSFYNVISTTEVHLLC